MNCNIDMRPSHTVVVASSNVGCIPRYRRMIKTANWSLLAGPMLTSSVVLFFQNYSRCEKIKIRRDRLRRRLLNSKMLRGPF